MSVKRRVLVDKITRDDTPKDICSDCDRKKVYITHVIVFARRHVARSNASNIKARGADESQSYEKINEISAQRAGLEKKRLGQIGEGANGVCGRHAKEV